MSSPIVAYAVNSYIWALLQKKLDWVRINGLVPILPAQQQPELMNSTKPFALYSASSDFNDGELEPQAVEVISYLIYGSDQNAVNDAVTLLRDAFKAENSAVNINDWIRSEDNEFIGDIDRNVFITYTQVMNTESAGESSSEGGKVNGFVSIRLGHHTTPDDYSI